MDAALAPGAAHPVLKILPGQPLQTRPTALIILMRVHPVIRVLAAAGLLVVFAVGATAQSVSSPAWLAPYRDNAARLIKAATADDFAWQRLAELTDTFGHRLSGSENLARAIRLGRRGDEAGRARERAHRAGDGAALGPRPRERGDRRIRRSTRSRCSVSAAPSRRRPAASKPRCSSVSSFDDLRSRGGEARGRIVLFNAPFTRYADTVTYRTGGARAAAQHGAVAVLVRVGRPDRPAHAAHRQRAVRAGHAADSGRRDRRRGRQSHRPAGRRAASASACA